MFKPLHLAAALATTLLLSACGGGGDDPPEAAGPATAAEALEADGSEAIPSVDADRRDPSQPCSPLVTGWTCASVGGVIRGLSKAGLVLANRGDTIAVAEDATSFVFPTEWRRHSTYAVTIRQQPAFQQCRLKHARGVVGRKDVTSVRVECADIDAVVTTVAATQGPTVGVDGADNLHFAAANALVRRAPDGTTTAIPNTAPFSYFAVGRDGSVYTAVLFALLKYSPLGDVTPVAVSGPGQGPLFDNPAGIAVGPTGDVFIAEFSRDFIRRVSPTGELSVFAQDLGRPVGLAIDAAGTVHVTDFARSHVVRIKPSGERSLLAGCDQFGSAADGTGAAACFYFPEALALDAAGNVYVADTQNRRVRLITPKGVVTTLAGSGLQSTQDGTGAAAGFVNPTGIAVDSRGRVFVADGGRIRQITGQAR
jgi:serine/threonine protein kinase, bacterial